MSTVHTYIQLYQIRCAHQHRCAKAWQRGNAPLKWTPQGVGDTPAQLSQTVLRHLSIKAHTHMRVSSTNELLLPHARETKSLILALSTYSLCGLDTDT